VKKETNQLNKSIEVMIYDQLYKAKTTYISEVRLMIGQLQVELRQYLKSYLVTLHRNHDQLST